MSFGFLIQEKHLEKSLNQANHFLEAQIIHITLQKHFAAIKHKLNLNEIEHERIVDKIFYFIYSCDSRKRKKGTSSTEQFEFKLLQEKNGVTQIIVGLRAVLPRWETNWQKTSGPGGAQKFFHRAGPGWALKFFHRPGLKKFSPDRAGLKLFLPGRAGPEKFYLVGPGRAQSNFCFPRDVTGAS